MASSTRHSWRPPSGPSRATSSSRAYRWSRSTRTTPSPPNSRMALPLVIRAGVQKAVAFEPAADHLVSVSVHGCGFMGLRGAFAAAETRVQLGPDPGLWLTLDGHRAVDAAAIYARLTGGGTAWPTRVSVTRG